MGTESGKKNLPSRAARAHHLPIVSWTVDKGAGLVLVDGRLGKGKIDTS